MTLLEDAMSTWHGYLVRRCFDLISAGRLNIALSEPTYEEFRVMQMIESEQGKAQSVAMEQSRRDAESSRGMEER